MRVVKNKMDNKIEEEIKERIALGNKAFFTNQKIFQSELIYIFFRIYLDQQSGYNLIV